MKERGVGGADNTVVREEVLTALQEVSTRPLDVTRIEDTVRLADLGFDSLKVLELLILLEQRFDIEFSEEELVPRNFRTLRAVITHLRER